jgi:hypothetical protein
MTIFQSMKRILLFVCLLFLTLTSFSQIAKDFMIGGAVDLIKSNQHGYFERTQGGVEANYFFSRTFTGMIGIEYWTEDHTISFVVGGRWFPIPEAFVRLRGLVGANDISVGGGWAKPFKENWRFEAISDIYADGHIAIRAGVAHVFRRKQ